MNQNSNNHYYKVLQNNAIKRTVLAIFGWVLGIIASLAVFVFVYLFYQFSEDGIIIMLIVCISLLALFLISSINYSVITRRTNRFREYIVLILGEQKTELDELAHMTSRSVSYVKRDLQKMINQYYFLFAMIDHTMNELIIYMPPLQQEPAVSKKTDQKEKKPLRMQPLLVVLCTVGIIAGLFFAGLKLFPIVADYLDLNWESLNIENLLDTQSDNTQDVQVNTETHVISETMNSGKIIPSDATEFTDGDVTWIVLKDNRPKSGTNILNYFGVPQESDGSGTMFIMTKQVYLTNTEYSYVFDQNGWIEYEEAFCKKKLDLWYSSNVSEELKVLAKMPNVTGAALSSSSADFAGSDYTGVVFPLSITETNEYIAKGYDSLKVSIDTAGSRCSWWLRSPGNKETDVSIIVSDGTFHNWDATKPSFALGFRPAMWIEADLNDYESLDQTNTILDNVSTEANYGEIIVFGEWRGNPIEWRVLDITGDKALLISKDILVARQYDSMDRKLGKGWSESEIRAWLNNDFLNKAFSPAEQNQIILSNNLNPNNAVYGTEGGPSTEDMIFLLSIDEANRHFECNENRIADFKMTDEDLDYLYRIYGDVYGSVREDLNHSLFQDVVWSWWLRSSGIDSGFASVVLGNGDSSGDIGSINYRGYLVISVVGVRPALYVNLAML